MLSSPDEAMSFLVEKILELSSKESDVPKNVVDLGDERTDGGYEVSELSYAQNGYAKIFKLNGLTSFPNGEKVSPAGSKGSCCN